MAEYIPVDKPMRKLSTTLTLSYMQSLVGGFIRFIDLDTGDVMIVNESASECLALNETASTLAGKAGPIYGHAILCDPEEIE